MKLIIVPILMSLLFIQTFSKWAILIEYNLNRNFIANNLCVNKSRPKLHCNGKCQMMKRLAEEEKQNSSGNTIKISSQEQFFTNELIQVDLPTPNTIALLFNEEPPIPSYSSPIDSIFHPPA